MRTIALRIALRWQQRRQLAQRLAPLARPGAEREGVATLKLEAHLPDRLRLRLVRADIGLHARHVLIAASIIAALGAGAFISGHPLTGLAIITLPPSAALLFIEWRATRNLKAFVAGLPFFLDAIQQLLRVGNSLQQALAKALESANPAMRRYIAPAVNRIQHGMPAADCLGWAAERIAVPELRMFAAAVRINARYGGSIAAILANLGQLLRHAARVERELKSATAETRFSGVVLMAMPLVITAMIAAINPEYVRFFTETASGHRLAAIAVGLQLLGMAIMRRLMRLAF